LVLAVLLRESMTNQLSHQNFFPDLSKLTLRRVFKTDQGWIMEAEGQDSALCPGCQSISRSRRSRYWRSLQVLPIQGTPVLLRLHVGRWHCRNAGCERRIFTERPFKVCAPYARQTKRSDEHALEQRASGRTRKRTQNAEATNVWACRYRTAPHSPTTRAGTHGSINAAPKLRQSH
jgi:transposase